MTLAVPGMKFLAQGTERDICERVPMKNRSPNAELIRVPELGGYIMGCYPNVTVFAESLDDDTACARVARDMIGPDRADAEAELEREAAREEKRRRKDERRKEKEAEKEAKRRRRREEDD